MKTPGIILRRYPYEEPYHLNLVLTACNGVFGGRLEYYCNADDLATLGRALARFPRQTPDEHVYELGSSEPERRFAFHLQLRFFTTDSAGHCGLSIVMNNNGCQPDAAAVTLGMRAEPAAINHLGALLVAFGKLKHRQLMWQVSGEGELCEEIEKDNGEEGPCYGSQALRT
jgi:hypothetical protein